MTGFELDLSIYEELYGGVTGVRFSSLYHAISIFTVYIPHALILLITFNKHFRVTLPVAIATVVVFFTGATTLTNVVASNVPEGIGLFYRYTTALQLIIWIIGIILCLLMIKIHWTKLLYVLFIIISYYHFVRITGLFLIEYNFYLLIPNRMINLQNGIMNLMIMAVTLPFIIVFINKVIKPAIFNIENAAWKYMWILPALTYGILYTINIAIDTQFSMRFSVQHLIFLFILKAASILLYLYALKMIQQIDKHARLSENTALTKRNLVMQQERYEMLKLQIDDAKRSENDLLHQLDMIQKYIDTGDVAELADLIGEYKDSLPDDSEFAFCENHIVNPILFHYAGIAGKEGIQIDIRADIPEKIEINDSDLCIIFGNCIENAVEACREADGDRYIKIRAKLTKEMLTIIFVNNFDGNIKKEGGKFMSRKRAGEGIGISSVKAVTQKYGEPAQFEADGNEFKTTIILPVMQKNQYIAEKCS